MDETRFLEQISTILDQKLGSRLGRMQKELRSEMQAQFAEVRGDIGGLQGQFAEMREDVGGLQGQFAEMREDMSALRQDVQGVRTDMVQLENRVDIKLENHTKRIELKIENDVSSQLGALCDGYQMNKERHQQLRIQVEKLDQRVAYLEMIKR
ncbi:MAG: hypothetical protein VB085_05745 [Peptococcaceae bacterium]|nr:hypothetical protein [Peptococcaceae bacterium]